MAGAAGSRALSNPKRHLPGKVAAKLAYVKGWGSVAEWEQWLAHTALSKFRALTNFLHFSDNSNFTISQNALV
jgi:hypothetical protein